MMKTAIVILNWNTPDYLKKFLPGVLAAAGCGKDGDPEGAQAEVIVADNASEDISASVMKHFFPKVRFIRLDRNYGFTGGYNRALEQLQYDGFRYYLLMNTDIEVQDGFLEPLVDFMESNPDCGACAPKLHSYQDRDMFEYAGAAGGYIDRYGYPFCRGRVMNTVEKDEGQYDGGAKNIFWATGACMMVRAEIFHETGGFDDRFFAHMEEIDLCWRMQLSGYRICSVPGSVAWHIGGGTLPATSPFKLRLNYRNNLLMLENNLARTLALEAVHKSENLAAAASAGCWKARRVILWRMVLDGIAAIAYICSFKKEYFKAVLQAHKEYRAMRVRTGREEIRQWLESGGSNLRVRGIYPEWMVPKAIFRRKEFIEEIRDFQNRV